MKEDKARRAVEDTGAAQDRADKLTVSLTDICVEDADVAQVTVPLYVAMSNSPV